MAYQEAGNFLSRLAVAFWINYQLIKEFYLASCLTCYRQHSQLNVLESSNIAR